jgi:hypothetical protein
MISSGEMPAAAAVRACVALVERFALCAAVVAVPVWITEE